MHRITIIEDDQDIRSELVLLLENEGYRATALTDFTNAAKQIKHHMPDLVLLDLGLPEKDGFILCKEIRESSRIPIIFVTSRDNSIDELKALSLGGDDYVTKPYNIPVLLARIKVVLRRNASDELQTDTMEVNGLLLNLSKGTLEYGKNCCDATKNELKILCCLMRNPGNIVTRTDMIEYLWDNQVYIDDNTLSVNITRLRTKLDELGCFHYITTKRGLGYKI